MVLVLALSLCDSVVSVVPRSNTSWVAFVDQFNVHDFDVWSDHVHATPY